MFNLISAHHVLNGEVGTLQFLPDGRALLCATVEEDADEADLDPDEEEGDVVGVLKVWNPQRGVLLARRKYDYGQSPVVSADGRWIAWGGDRGRIRLIPTTGEPTDRAIRVQGARERAEDLVFRPGGSILMFRLGVAWWQLDGPTSTPESCSPAPVFRLYCVSPDGRQLVLCMGKDKADDRAPTYVWDLAGNQPRATLLPIEGGLRTAVWHPTRPLVAGCSWWEGGFAVWDLTNPSAPRRLMAEGGACNDIAFLPDGRLATAHESGDLNLWDIEFSQLLAHVDTVELRGLKLAEETEQITITYDRPGIGAVAASPDGRVVGVGTHGGVIALYDVAR